MKTITTCEKIVVKDDDVVGCLKNYDPSNYNSTISNSAQQLENYKGHYKQQCESTFK